MFYMVLQFHSNPYSFVAELGWKFDYNMTLTCLQIHPHNLLWVKSVAVAVVYIYIYAKEWGTVWVSLWESGFSTQKDTRACNYCYSGFWSEAKNARQNDEAVEVQKWLSS